MDRWWIEETGPLGLLLDAAPWLCMLLGLGITGWLFATRHREPNAELAKIRAATAPRPAPLRGVPVIAAAALVPGRSVETLPAMLGLCVTGVAALRLPPGKAGEAALQLIDPSRAALEADRKALLALIPPDAPGRRLTFKGIEDRGFRRAVRRLPGIGTAAATAIGLGERRSRPGRRVLAAIGVALAAAGFALGILLHDRYRNEAAFGIGFWAVLIALALGLMGSGPVLALSARGREASREVEALRAWVDLPPLERSAALRAEVARSGPRTPEQVLPYALAVSPKNLWRGLFELLGSAIMAERGWRDPEWITGPRAGGLVEQLVETAERVAEAERVDSRD